MFQIISGTSKTVSGTQNLERNVPNTAHKNVPTSSVLLGSLFLLVFPVGGFYVRGGGTQLWGWTIRRPAGKDIRRVHAIQ
jgi:hypothetical protein